MEGLCILGGNQKPNSIDLTSLGYIKFGVVAVRNKLSSEFQNTQPLITNKKPMPALTPNGSITAKIGLENLPEAHLT